MSDFKFSVYSKDVEDALAAIPGKAHFGASVGLNRTANEIQDAIRAGLPQHFTLRRSDFVKKTIYRKPGEDFASKDKLNAGVRIHDERDFLSKFEAGGSKRPTRGAAIAIPVGARPTKQSIVPVRFRLQTLFFNKAGLASQAKTILGTKQKGRRKTLLKRSVADDVFIKNGKVWQRQGKKRMNLLWVFKPASWLPPSLRFVETAMRVHRERFAPNVIGAIEIELSRGLNLKNGPSK